MDNNEINMVEIDTEKLREFIEHNHISFSGIDAELGKSKGYIQSVINSGCIGATEYKLLKLVYSLPNDAFDKAITAIPQNGYHLSTEFDSDRVRCRLYKDGKEIGYGYAVIRDERFTNENVAIAQALSYAAHMAYKNCECRNEFGREV